MAKSFVFSLWRAPTALLYRLILASLSKRNMQTQISKLGRSRPQSKGLHYFKSAEVCTCKHFQKSARSNDIKSLFFLHTKGLHFMRLYKSPFTRRPCESSSIPLTPKVSVRILKPQVSNRSAHLKSLLALAHI